MSWSAGRPPVKRRLSAHSKRLASSFVTGKTETAEYIFWFIRLIQKQSSSPSDLKDTAARIWSSTPVNPCGKTASHYCSEPKGPDPMLDDLQPGVLRTNRHFASIERPFIGLRPFA